MEPEIRSVEGLENRATSHKRRGRALPTVLSIILLTLLAGLLYRQSSFVAYARTTESAAVWGMRLDQVISLRGQIYSLVRTVALTGIDPEAQSKQIERRVDGVQTSWEDLRNEAVHDSDWAAMLEPNEGPINEGIDRLTLAALRGANGLRRSQAGEISRQAIVVREIDGQMRLALRELERQISEAETAARSEHEAAHVTLTQTHNTTFTGFVVLILLSKAGMSAFTGRQLLGKWRERKNTLSSAVPTRS